MELHKCSSVPSTILPLCYLGPIELYIHLVNDISTIDVDSHYVQQTFANRCEIMGANGIMTLSIPIEKPKDKVSIRDIIISNHQDWRTLHWRAIESAYNSSPFFEYYRDDLLNIYQKNHKFLLDFNLEIQNKVLELLNFETTNISLSVSYIKHVKNNEFDRRNEIQAKKKGIYLHNNLKVPYYQVFENRHGFAPNLSIIDLLFNMGNESRIYLKRAE